MAEPRKRSRFDERPTSPPAGSGADRQRSRSPTAAREDRKNYRERSPERKPSIPTHPDRVRQVSSSGDAPEDLFDGIEEVDGDFVKDIDINDLRNRYTLTKGDTQKMIKEKSGADVTTRGEYAPNKALAPPNRPPLHLHITARSREDISKAIQMIQELMGKELPNLIDERRFRRREQPRDEVERDEFGRRKWPEAKIPIDLEPISGFNLRAQIVGAQGAYVKHIQSQSTCRVQIKGRGSGFAERDTNMESDEPMYLHVTSPRPDSVEQGRELCESLLGRVRERYHEFKANGGRRNGPQGQGGRSDYGRGGYGGGGGQGSPNSYNYGQQDQHGYGASNPYGAYGQQDQQQAYGAGAGDPNQADPYAAYGGYEAYCQWYYQWQQQQSQQQGDAAASSAPGTDPSAYQYQTAAPGTDPNAAYDYHQHAYNGYNGYGGHGQEGANTYGSPHPGPDASPNAPGRQA